MSVISITITESDFQVLAGIPKTVTITTNVPATIFYTLDGSDPSTSSSIVIGPITMPTTQPTVILKVFATDGIDSTSIITRQFAPNVVNNRNAHDQITNIDFIGGTRFLCSPLVPTNLGQHQNISPLQTVDNPDVVGISTGFDGTATGTSAAETDKPLNELNIIYSETDKIGQRGKGIGNLPADVTIRIPVPVHPSTSSDANSPLFNPKAQVIFQDGRETPADENISKMNRQYFNLEPSETTRDGSHLYNTAFEGSVPHGSFLRPHYNPKDNTYNMYYMDSNTQRWIISKEPVSFNNNVTRLDKIIFPIRGAGVGKVFKWHQFHYTKLI